MTIKLEWNKENGEVLVKIKGQAGTWGRPIIDSNNVVYRSTRVAAEAVNTSQSSVRSAIGTDVLVKGRLWRFATEAEVLKFGDGAAEQLNPKGQPTETVEPPVVHKAVAYVRAPFTGVRWPDGSVTVRLSAGGDWTMTRALVEELPAEIAGSCSWLA
jgi:hypothetical protein